MSTRGIKGRVHLSGGNAGSRAEKKKRLRETAQRRRPALLVEDIREERRVCYARSKMEAVPMPPPMHAVTSP